MANTTSFSSQSKPVALSFDKTLLWSLAGLIALCGVFFFWNLGGYPLFDVDEPRYAEAAREMIESGNWITPYFNYELRFDKPVFFYWLIAASYKVFGVTEFAARLVGALSASALTFTLYFVGRSQGGNRFGLLSALVFASSLQIIGVSRMAITDMTLAAFIGLTTFALYFVAARSPKWWIAAGLLSGLAMLTKGPVGMVLPGAVLVFYSLFAGKFKACFFNRYFPLGLLIAFLVAVPWYILAYQQNGQIFLDELYNHNFSRFNGKVSYHVEAWWYFIPVVLAGFLPWVLYLPASVGQFFQNLKTQLQQPVIQYTLFGLVWAGFVFLFFSVSQTKLLTYIQPMYPALAILVAYGLDQFIADKKASKWVIVPQAILTVALLIATPILVNKLGLILPKEARAFAGDTSNIWALSLLTLGSLVTLILWLRRQVQPAVVAQLLTFAAVTVVGFTFIVPKVNNLTQGAMLDFIEETNINGVQQPLAIYEITRPSLTFYTRQKIPHIARGDKEMLNAMVIKHPEQFIITKTRLLDDLKQQVQNIGVLSVINTQTPYVLTKLSTNQKAAN